ncbi:ECF transporter S component [Serpentinicella sp. ANB-PHB4]|uniref:ECF transporter S component n=1 Tax=Serpentinicella sp. ANB-PHB4 TaxID=3074076 RepID=UPI00285716C5|nr:ECF transporter S component [Serpentinicella sp. ANB-PHB4]MDR5659304.1 ECF transporter S component [Serpentinicella sp. ANB-PHB4]
MINNYWSTISLVMVIFVILSFYIYYEKKRGSSKELALIATMAGFAAISRIPFAVIPAAQPTSFIVLITGYVFGSQAGFMVGSLAAFSSNIFLGHGPWTPWQMIAWGCVGLTGGLIRLIKTKQVYMILVIVAIGWGFFYGWIMNLWNWLAFVYPLNLDTFIAINLSSLSFDVIHALCNGIFMWVMGKDLIVILKRFSRRLYVQYETDLEKS